MKLRITLILIALILCVAPMGTHAAGSQATLARFPVYFNGELIDNEQAAYPLLVYNDITYFPMTWDFSSGLGLSTSYSNATGLIIEKTTAPSSLKQTITAQNDLSKAYDISMPDFPIKVNGKVIDNGKEVYPIFTFRGITYFPLTWHYIVDEFGWESDYSEDTGLKISSYSSGDVESSEATEDSTELNNNILKYDMSTMDFWINVESQDVTKSIMNKAKMVTKVYMGSGSIHIGGESSMNIDPLNVHLMQNENLSFQITGSSQPGVQETIEDMLKLWTLDGQYIYDVLSVDTMGHELDEWWTAPNGTEVKMSDEGIGFWIYIKKASMKYNEAYEQEILARGISTEYKNKEMDMSWVNSTAGKNNYKTLEDNVGNVQAVLELIEKVNASSFRETHGLRIDYWDTAASQAEFIYWLDQLPEDFQYVVKDRNKIEIQYKFQNGKYSHYTRFLSFNPRAYIDLPGYRDERYITFGGFNVSDIDYGDLYEAFMKFSLSLLTEDYEEIYNYAKTNEAELLEVALNNQVYKTTIGETECIFYTYAKVYLTRVEGEQ